MRGRGNNNRKGPNPLTRNYESNGPDVKIRGSAQQVAEKYAALARDAQSAGDRVMAENYLQHAEHYNRIIAAAQAQQSAQQPRDYRDDSDDDSDEDRNDTDTRSENRQPQQDNRQPQRANDGSGPQPVIEGTPAEVAYRQNGANGDASAHVNGAAGKEGEAEERKPRRGRRGSRQREEAAAEAGEAPAEGGKAEGSKERAARESAAQN